MYKNFSKFLRCQESVYMSVTRWSKSQRRRLNLYVTHRHQNLTVLKNPLQDTKMNADIRVGETRSNAVRYMYSLESNQPECPCISVSHCDFTSPNAASVHYISLKNLTVKYDTML